MAGRIDDDLMDACVFYSLYLFDVARRALSSPERDDRDRGSQSDLMMVSLWVVDGGRGDAGHERCDVAVADGMVEYDSTS